jgi:L-2-hydroxyglutarate oxidase LhgO
LKAFTMRPTADLDVAIIGAGVVGLAVAAQLAPRLSVAILERHHTFGMENSSHNSGVIHAGIYYPPGWLKTVLCIEGNRLLYQWADEHKVPYRRLGKLIIAWHEEELPALHRLLEGARANGVPELHLLSSAEVSRLQPGLRAAGAIFSATSGVVDQMAFMRSLLEEARAHGAFVAFRHEVIGLRRHGGGLLVRYRSPDGAEQELGVRYVVNCAGLQADRIGSMLGYEPDGGPHNPPFRHFINRGAYFDVVRKEVAARVRHLLYPLPHQDRTGLGLHVTLDVEGNVHLGPDAQWLPEDAPLDFRSRPEALPQFLEGGRQFFPDLRAEDLAPGQVGYRPKLHPPGQGPKDFLIWHHQGYVHLGGIESPGFTASLAIARHVARLLGLVR